jgi:hypothetical protein
VGLNPMILDRVFTSVYEGEEIDGLLKPRGSKSHMQCNQMTTLVTWLVDMEWM